MSKTIAVIGITGNQGGSAADTFLQSSGWRVRAVTRDSSRPSAQQWTSKGVELVTGDIDDVESLKLAFANVDAIFGMTDFWNPFFDETHHTEARQQGITINEYCYNLELQRGKNICTAAASVTSLKRFIYSSLSDTRRWSNGRYMENWHFDSKAQVANFIRTSPDMGSLCRKTSFLQVGLYMNNWKFGPFGEIEKDVSGAFYHLTIGDGTRKLPFIWTRRDTGVLVKALIDSEPGKTLLGLSRWMTWQEYMEIWAKALGVKLQGNGIKTITPQEMKDLIRMDTLKEEVVASHAYFADFGYTGGDQEVLLPEDIGVTPGDLTSLEEYIKSEDWSKLL